MQVGDQLGPNCVVRQHGEDEQDQPSGQGAFAILPTGEILEDLEKKSWAKDPFYIGSPEEYEVWDLCNKMSDDWLEQYKWQYWQNLIPADEASVRRREARTAQLRAMADDVREAEGLGTCWWRKESAKQAIIRALEREGYLVVDDLLGAAEAAALAEATLRCSEGTRMDNFRGSVKGMRGDLVTWLDTKDPAEITGPMEDLASAAVPELEPFVQAVREIVLTLEAALPQASGVVARTHVQLGRFPGRSSEEEVKGKVAPTARYLRHFDNHAPLADGGRVENGRVLTCIYYINEGWAAEDGGNLRLFAPFSPPNPPLKIWDEVEPLYNRLLVFWSEALPHEVCSVTGDRDRLALTIWCSRPFGNNVPLVEGGDEVAGDSGSTSALFLD